MKKSKVVALVAAIVTIAACTNPSPPPKPPDPPPPESCPSLRSAALDVEAPERGPVPMLTPVSLPAHLELLPKKTDIFSNDAEMRVPAGAEAIRWTVSLGGCSGSMLTPDYVLTANHCSPSVGARYTSGGCLASGCSRDLTVSQRVECDSNLDYCVLKVTSTNPAALRLQRYPAAVQVEDSELTFGKDGVATRVFTVGFPGDKGRAMLAEGYAKAYRGDFMVYNLGSINGNSGGAVWAAEGRKLVGMTNHGPHSLGQPGWNGNDPENSSAWNGGPKMPVMFAKSRILKELFPNGKSAVADNCGRLK